MRDGRKKHNRTTQLAVGAVALGAVLLVGALTFWGNFTVADINQSSLQNIQATQPNSTTEDDSEEQGSSSLADNASKAPSGPVDSPVDSSDFSKYQALEIDQQFLHPACPIVLPEPALKLDYSHQATIETWHLSTDLSCASYAMNLLQQLHPTGVELVQAGYLDLTGQSWGCTIRTPDNQAINVVLMPQRAFSARSETNLLDVTVIKMLAPEE